MQHAQFSILPIVQLLDFKYVSLHLIYMNFGGTHLFKLLLSLIFIIKIEHCYYHFDKTEYEHSNHFTDFARKCNYGIVNYLFIQFLTIFSV